MKILAISGSLREASANTAVLRAIAPLLPVGTSYRIWEGLGSLPHFSPEIDGDASPPAAIAYRRMLAAADGVIICTPEYAFGMPGVLKNALDWAVSSGAFDRKPVARISASPLPSGGAKAHAWLSQTLTALGAEQSEETSLIIPAIKGKLDGEGRLTDGVTLAALGRVADALLHAVQHPRGWD